MATPEILITAGVVAILGAAIGGGLRAFGAEVPLLESTARQLLLGLVGAGLLALGLYEQALTAEGPRPPPPRLALDPMPSIDFRSSEKDDSLAGGKGYLLVTTVVAARNPTEEPVTWTVTAATLQVGGAKVPFRPYYFSSLNNEVEPWLGPNPVAVGPVTLDRRKAEAKEMMFLPEDAGGGLYRWDAFTQKVLKDGESHPVFTITVTPTSGDAAGSPVEQHCVAQLGGLLPDLRARAAKGARSVWITAGCST